MKLVKRLLTIIAASVLVLSMGGMKIHADDPTYTFVVKNSTSEGYTYQVYQMLVGDVATINGKTVFSNVQWGTGVQLSTTQEAMYNMANLSGNDRTAAKFAEWLSKQDPTVFHQMMIKVGVQDGSSLTNPQELTYGTYNINGTDINGYGKIGLQPGYYLVRNTAVPSDDTYSDYIVIVLDGNKYIEPKSAPAPTPEKKVTDKNDSYPNAEEANLTADSADHDIGDKISYTLSVRLPSNYSDYTSYKLVFKDEMSKGLTYNGDAKIYYGASDVTGVSIQLTEVDNTAPLYSDSKTYSYEITDLMTVAAASGVVNGDFITIKYTATLNNDAVIGNAGNPNAFTLQYSNNPTGTTLGTTETDVTTVFTFKLVFNKVDGDNKPLSGADFELYKWIEGNGTVSGNWVNVTALADGSINPAKTKSSVEETRECVFTFSGLDDGLYKLVETKTPTGFNSIKKLIINYLLSLL